LTRNQTAASKYQSVMGAASSYPESRGHTASDKYLANGRPKQIKRG